MADIAETASVLSAARGGDQTLVRLRDVSTFAWSALTQRAIEPNGYYLPDWALAVDTSARDRSDMSALCGWTDSRDMIGLLPVIPAHRAYRLPLPFLVAAEAYGTLRTPLLDCSRAVEASRLLMEEAARIGAHAIVLRDIPLEGATVTAFRRALDAANLTPITLHSYPRAWLDATKDADALLREALGAKKLKELRRQRHRLSEFGALTFSIAKTEEEVASALNIFLALEAGGWKGRRGTALARHAGDATFIRRATVGLACKGQCEIATLTAGHTPVAAGIVLKHRDRAFWFKLGFDQQFARFSPGVQLAIDLTRHFCADPDIAFVDSTASANNSLIDPIWRNRFLIGDLLIPLRPNDPWIPAIRATLAVHKAADSAARRLLRLARRARERLR